MCQARTPPQGLSLKIWKLVTLELTAAAIAGSPMHYTNLANDILDSDNYVFQILLQNYCGLWSTSTESTCLWNWTQVLLFVSSVTTHTSQHGHFQTPEVEAVKHPVAHLLG